MLEKVQKSYKLIPEFKKCGIGLYDISIILNYENANVAL